MKVYAEPRWSGADAGEGGVRQVMEHVAPYLEALGVEWVDAPDQADLIHCHMTPYVNTRRWLEAHTETPYVCSNHGLYWSEYDWDRGSLAANADVAEGLRLADVVTAPTEWVAHALRRGMLLDVRVVPHGVDLAEFTPSAEPGSYALYDKTRVDPVCDPSPVIALAQRMPDQKFVMTGDPPVDLPNVMKLGRIPYADARELTRGAGVYLAVTRETFGLATLQAMAAGVPVVGYAFGGQAEICPQIDEGGIMVPPGDIDALAEAVLVAFKNRKALSKRARITAESYTWQRAAEGYMAAYRDAIEAHGSPVRATVITTAYNAEGTVRRTIESALAELGPNDEYIVVDDASTDGTHAMIEAHARELKRDKRFVYLRRAENGYLAQARNDALAQARGRYVTCLDADDALLPGALDTLAGALDADRTMQIAYGKLRFVRGEDGEPEDYGHGPGESPWPPEFNLAAQMATTNFSPMPYSAMVRTPWLKRAGGWRTRCRTAEDLDLWMRLVSGGARPRRVTEAQVLTYYTSESSMSATEPLGDWGQWYPWTGAAGQRCAPPWGIAFAPPAHTGELWWPVSHHAEPRVAVVIPVGPGHERYVLDAVDSVQAQTLRQWECIVVHDSAGELPALPAWVRLVGSRSLNVSHVAHARNAGVERVTAPLVVFLDADDYLDADALEHLVATIERNPGLAVVYPDYWERDPVPDATLKGRITYRYTPHELPDWTCDWVERPGAIHGITAVYRTAAVREVGGFDVEAAGWEDGDLQMALTYAGHCSARLARRAYVYCRDRGTVGTWHYADSEERATKIGAWLKAKYAGRQNMSCGGCSGQQGRAASPVVSAFGGDGGGAAVVLSGDMVEVAYVGGAAGDFTLRGRSSGAQYRFGKGRHARKAVLLEDLEFFESSQDYRVEAEGMPQPADAPPRLAADGPPHGGRASVA